MKNLIVKMIPLLMAFILLLPAHLNAQAAKTCEKKPILSFEEGDRNRNNAIKIDTVKRSLPIVDINSQLTIYIDKTCLLQKATELFGTKTPEEHKKKLDTMDEIGKILEMQSAILNAAIVDPDDTKEQRDEKAKLFKKTMVPVEEFLLKSELLSEKAEKVMEESVESISKIMAENISPDEKAKKVDDAKVEMYREILIIAGREIETFTADLKKSIGPVYFRLGGWMVHNGTERPIHIEGFDTYEKSEYKQIPLVSKPTPEEFAEKMKAIRAQADKANKDGISAVLEIKTNLKDIAQKLKAELKPAFQCTLDSLEEILKDPEIIDLKIQLDQTRAFLDNLKKLKEKADDFLDKTRELKSSLADLETQYNLFYNIDSVKDVLKDDLENIKADFNNAKREIENIIKTKPNLKIDLKKIKTKIETDCFANIKAIFDKYFGLLKDFWAMAKNKFSIVKENAPILSGFGEEVERLLLDDIPERGSVDLTFTGPREEGDIIAFQAALEKPSEDGTDNGKPPKIIAEQSLMMFRLTKIEISPGLIFVDPLGTNENVTLTKDFQASPSYSILYKPAFRKSIFYNKFLRFGIGLNVSALDFNQDSTLELGLGLVLSGFKDYLQVGFGRNMEFDSWYWFFGLNLPFAEISLPTATTGVKSK